MQANGIEWCSQSTLQLLGKPAVAPTRLPAGGCVAAFYAPQYLAVSTTTRITRWGGFAMRARWLGLVGVTMLTGCVTCGTEALAADAAVAKPGRGPIRGILYNEDDSHRFVVDPPGAMKPERLDQLVDELADSQVTVMLICCNAKNTGYASKVWDVHCRGFDPAKD